MRGTILNKLDIYVTYDPETNTVEIRQFYAPWVGVEEGVVYKIFENELYWR